MREYIRYDKNLRAIAGSSVRRKHAPKNGIWREITEIDCCDLTGEWFFLDLYEPPFFQGLLDFPNHAVGMSSSDPNLVGIDGPSEVMLYINVRDSNGHFNSSLADIAGNSGTLTLTQGVNSVTYSFTDQAFTFDNSTPGVSMVLFDTLFGGSAVGSITLISPSAGDFNTIEPIHISITM